jgi:putative transcriptional regulator
MFLQGGAIMELKIKHLLDKKGYKQRDLAKALEVSETIVSLWCSNRITPSNRHLQEIAKYLKVEVKQLLK